jgi:glucokinase
MNLIAGDIGGTKSALAWTRGEAAVPRFERVYASAAFASAGDLLRRFIADAGETVPPERVLLAVPGPVDAQRSRLTNLDWTLDAAALGREFGGAGVRLVNDFEAAAAGVTALAPDERIVLNPQPLDDDGVRVVTGAGTGLGLAFVAGGEGRLRVFPSEGGHTDFAPADARQMRLLDMLRRRHGHVSWERVASGSALDDLYRFCRAERGQKTGDGVLDGATLSARAAAGDPAANAALDLFVDLYGAWAGNLALLFQPRAGLYLAGGVTRHLRGRLQDPRFMRAAADKGRMRDVVERTPFILVSSERLGVAGAIVLGRALPPWQPIPPIA